MRKRSQRITAFRRTIISSLLVTARAGGPELRRALKREGGESPQQLKVLLDTIVERQDTRREGKVQRRRLRGHGTFGCLGESVCRNGA